jgi:hypothetical protein
MNVLVKGFKDSNVLGKEEWGKGIAGQAHQPSHARLEG